jgi:hypothetical protein
MKGAGRLIGTAPPSSSHFAARKAFERFSPV